MKLFSSQQLQAWDTATIKEENISSITLLERAANGFVQKFITLFDTHHPVSVFCGPGNNGGDGLAIARILDHFSFEVKIWLPPPSYRINPSAEFLDNLNRLPDHGHIPIYEINLNELPSMAKEEIIIDALFGIGLNRPLDLFYEDLVFWINSLQNTIVAVDIPSGLYVDKHTNSTSIEADYTISFESPKMAFLLAENNKKVGQWFSVDIGLCHSYYVTSPVTKYIIEKSIVKATVKKRNKFGHKGTYGHALLINGSHGKAGASILASLACLRSGVGLVTNHIPSNLATILQIAVPEAMVSIDDHFYYWSTLPEDLGRYEVIGLGSGINTKESSGRILADLLDKWSGPMVIDADGLNLISQNPEILKKIPSESILCPHLKEFERLFGVSSNDFDRLEKLVFSAKKFNLTIILKGAHTAVAVPDGTLFFNCTGNPGMATAGSGDVLTGILTALLAQGYTSRESALLGVYIHGLAGDFARDHLGHESLIASDIISYLGTAFKDLQIN